MVTLFFQSSQPSPPKAYAMKHFQQYRESLIEFSKVMTFS